MELFTRNEGLCMLRVLSQSIICIRICSKGKTFGLQDMTVSYWDKFNNYCDTHVYL